MDKLVLQHWQPYSISKIRSLRQKCVVAISPLIVNYRPLQFRSRVRMLARKNTAPKLPPASTFELFSGRISTLKPGAGRCRALRLIYVILFFPILSNHALTASDYEGLSWALDYQHRKVARFAGWQCNPNLMTLCLGTIFSSATIAAPRFCFITQRLTTKTRTS